MRYVRTRSIHYDGGVNARSLLRQVTIPIECDQSWSDMRGTDTQRFCAHCKTSVHNLSAMDSSQASDFLRSLTGPACVALYRRPDGTVVTSDCTKFSDFQAKFVQLASDGSNRSIRSALLALSLIGFGTAFVAPTDATFAAGGMNFGNVRAKTKPASRKSEYPSRILLVGSTSRRTAYYLKNAGHRVVVQAQEVCFETIGFDIILGAEETGVADGVIRLPLERSPWDNLIAVERALLRTKSGINTCE